MDQCLDLQKMGAAMRSYFWPKATLTELNCIAHEIDPRAGHDGSSYRVRCAAHGEASSGQNLALAIGVNDAVIAKCHSRECAPDAILKAMIDRSAQLRSLIEAQREKFDNDAGSPPIDISSLKPGGSHPSSACRAAAASEAASRTGEGVAEPEAAPDNGDKLWRFEKARALYDDVKQEPSDGLRWLTDVRGLDSDVILTMPGINDVLRFAPELLDPRTERDEGAALVVLYSSADGAPSTTQQIFLKGDPPRKVRQRYAKGAEKRGTRVLLKWDPGEDDLIVLCEGVVSALSAVQMYGVAAAATGDTSGLKGFEPPEGCRRLAVAIENDASDASLKAAEALRDRLEIDRPDVLVAFLPKPQPLSGGAGGEDLNDVLMGQATIDGPDRPYSFADWRKQHLSDEAREHNRRLIDVLAAVERDFATRTHGGDLQAADLNLDELGEPTPERRVLGDVLSRRRVTLLAGPGGVGKSGFALGAAVSIATGKDFLALRHPSQADERHGVVLVTAEETADDVKNRAHAIRKHHEVTGQQQAPIKLLAGADAQRIQLLHRPTNKNLELNIPSIRSVVQLIIQSDAAALILDPIGMLSGVEDNSTSEGRMVMGLLQHIADRCDVAVMVLHHPRKRPAGMTTKSYSVEDVGGTAAWTNHARAAFLLDRLTQETRKILDIPEVELIDYLGDRTRCCDDLVTLTHVKANSARLKGANRPDLFRLEVVPIGQVESEIETQRCEDTCEEPQTSYAIDPVNPDSDERIQRIRDIGKKKSDDAKSAAEKDKENDVEAAFHALGLQRDDLPDMIDHFEEKRRAHLVDGGKSGDFAAVSGSSNNWIGFIFDGFRELSFGDLSEDVCEKSSRRRELFQKILEYVSSSAADDNRTLEIVELPNRHRNPKRVYRALNKPRDEDVLAAIERERAEAEAAQGEVDGALPCEGGDRHRLDAIEDEAGAE